MVLLILLLIKTIESIYLCFFRPIAWILRNFVGLQSDLEYRSCSKIHVENTLYLSFLGYFDSYHCNFRTLEKHHYNSRILKRTIAILGFPQKCHLIRMEMTWTQLQAYMSTYTSLQPLSSVTDVRAPLVIFFFLLLPSSIAELNSIRCLRW